MVMGEEIPLFLDLPDSLVLEEAMPPDVLHVLAGLHASGSDVWVVGGALRDLLMGKEPKDWDLATTASPQQVMKAFRRVVPVGLRHGTVQVLTGQRGVEVTSVAGHGMDAILTDLGRRDFTVNALAVSFPDWRFLDPFGGRQDLVAGLLRAVGSARDRFREDPLRTLRAGRLQSLYGMRIHEGTFEALSTEAQELKRVASERIRDEMLRLLMGKHFMAAFESMWRAGIISIVLPELAHECRRDWRGAGGSALCARLVLTVHHCQYRIRPRLAALLRCASRPAAWLESINTQERLHDGYSCASSAESTVAVEVMRRWCMSNREIRETDALLRNQIPEGAGERSDASLIQLASHVGVDLLDDLLDLALADRLALDALEGNKGRVNEVERLRSRFQRLLAERPPLRVEDLAVNGRDVMQALGLSPGSGVGRALQWLHGEVMKQPGLNERKKLLDLLERAYHKDGLARLP